MYQRRESQNRLSRQLLTSSVPSFIVCVERGVGAWTAGSWTGSTAISASEVTCGELDPPQGSNVRGRRTRVDEGPRTILLVVAAVDFLAVCFVLGISGPGRAKEGYFDRRARGEMLVDQTGSHKQIVDREF